MPLGECMKNHTHRQFQAWMAWLDEQWNRPDRTDSYLMQVACEVRRANVKQPRKVQLKHFRLKFQEAEEKERKPMTRKQATDMAKSRWLGIMAATGTEVRRE